ncbi:MAG TPA: aromatic acid exporter family protein [Intrasporangium sp.]|nr:aromatic acid exporter family protein [Intrasporangium sp.]
MRPDEVWLRLRQRLRQAARRMWPTMPTTGDETRRLLGHAVSEVGRLTGAAVLAFVAARLLFPSVIDLTAPLTALLVVQASTVRTLQMGFIRVGAVLLGVLVAIAVSTYFGLSWWTLGAVIAASLLLAKLLRLGDQLLEVPISAMLILGVTSHGLAAETRVVNTLIGTAIGVAFSLLVPVAIPNTRARDAVRDVARSQGQLLDEVGLTLSARAPSAEETDGWLRRTEEIGVEVRRAADTVDEVEERRKLNPRALVALRMHPELRVALRRLDRCRTAEHVLLVMVGRARTAIAAEESPAADLRGAFAVVLQSLGSGLAAFAELIASDRVEAAEQALDRLHEIIGETRAMLTDLILVDVEARPGSDTWMLQGSLLAAIDQIIQQLDLEHPEQTAPAWSQRPSIERVPRTVAQTRQRLSEPVRRQIASVRRDRGGR